MGDIKSALDISMKKAEKMTGESGEKNASLTGDQKKEIAEIRKLYNAKLAEREIMLQSKIEKAKIRNPDDALSQIEELKKEFIKEKKALFDERDKKIEEIRSKKH
jgi:tRNA uridine 5-carbamoylmethylation protein Kti12|tara:strand:+ start:6332 stop:6646 length:315 start_codon:yes stop_codon:yes gene_type:complete